MGGHFSDGFIGSFAGSLTGSAMGASGLGQAGTGGAALTVARIMARAAVGGTISQMSGGSFANGAIAAAFAAALQEGLSAANVSTTIDETELEASQIAREERVRRRSVTVTLVDDGGHDTADAAAMAGLQHIEQQYFATGPAEEIVGLLYQDKSTGRYYFTDGALVPAAFRANISVKAPSRLAALFREGNLIQAGDYHTHPYIAGSNQEGFSDADNSNSRTQLYPRYLRTPKGDVFVLRSYDRNASALSGMRIGTSICPVPKCLMPHPGAR